MKKEKQIKENLSNEINPEVQDPLTEVLREGARRMLALAIEAEVEEFISQYHTLKDEGGRRAIVRNGYLPERDILTGLGSIPVSVPRVRDRRKEVSQPVQFTSSILLNLSKDQKYGRAHSLALPERSFYQRFP